MVSSQQGAKEIGEAYMSIATSSKYDFLTKKYMEIPACGTMIIGNVPSNYKNIYNEDTMCVVSNFMTPNMIATKILKMLNDKKLLREKTEKLKNIVLENFSKEKCYTNLKKNLYF